MSVSSQRTSAVSQALGELGAVVVLDADLRISAASPRAIELLGDLPLGERAPRLLCGSSNERPIAEMLAHGRGGEATLVRGHRAIKVRARPLAERRGWMLRLGEDAPELATRDEVVVHGIRTHNPAMKRLLHVARRVARSQVAVLIRGETGTGKELLARAIHLMSPRASGPFQAINCAALSPALLESELFGHVRGAFTGAVRDSPGHFRKATGGTIFLDEVAEMPAELQAKLLRVLETKSVTPVGSTESISIDVRIVAATHRSLRADVAAGRFRADLMYRLRKVPLFLPPLRKRPSDIALLAHYFVEQLNREGLRNIERLGDDAMDALHAYEWPGNVRELANVLEYASVVGEGAILHPSDLPPELLDPNASPDAWMSAPVNAPSDANTGGETRRILRALEESGGHKARAAKSLGISRVTLWRRLKELGLADPT